MKTFLAAAGSRLTSTLTTIRHLFGTDGPGEFSNFGLNKKGALSHTSSIFNDPTNTMVVSYRIRFSDQI